MVFSVKYRDAGGALREKAVEAANRSECLAKCKAQGIAPVGVKEGVKSKGKGAKGEGKRANSVLLLLSVAVVIVTGIWNFMSVKTFPEEKAPEKRIEKPTVKVPKAVKPATNTVAKAVKARIPEKPAKPEYVKRPGQLQLPNGKILTFPPPQVGETRKVHAYGHTYECDHLGNFRDITPRRLFHTAFEANFLGLAVEGGAFIPAFLTGLDEGDVKKMLLKKYEPIGDETEEEMAKLKAYDEMRCAALEYMEQGGKFDDFVNDFAQFEKQQRQMRAMGLGEVMNLVKQGKVAGAKEMAEAADKLMEQKGFKPIRLPEYVRKAFDDISAANQNQ